MLFQALVEVIKALRMNINPDVAFPSSPHSSLPPFNENESYEIQFRLSGAHTLLYPAEACKFLTHDGACGCKHLTAGVSFLSSPLQS